MRNLFLGLMTIFLIITGCSNVIENEEQMIKVQKRVGNENKFEDFRGITQNKQVLKVKEILNETNWENAKVSMSRPPDFQFVFLFKNPEIIQEKVVLHSVWIGPNKDKLEIVQGDNQYAQLTKENSAILFEIITGGKIAD